MSWCLKQCSCFAFSSILGCTVSCDLSSAVSYPTVSWFRDSDPQKLFLISWGCGPQGFAPQCGSQWGQSTLLVQGSSGRGWERGTGVHFSRATVWFCIMIPLSQKTLNLPGWRVNTSVHITSLWSLICILSFEIICMLSFERWFKEKKMDLFLSFQLRHKFLRNQNHC